MRADRIGNKVDHMVNEIALENALIAQVRVELAERNMHQKDLAAKMGIAPSALNRYLRQERGISMKVFAAMAEGLGMHAWDLMRVVEARAAKACAAK